MAATERVRRRPADIGKTNDKERPPSRSAMYDISPGFVRLLSRLDMSLAFTSYQSSKLYLLGRSLKGGLMVNEQRFEKLMGLHFAGGALYAVGKASIYRMENVLRPKQVMEHTFTDCFIPRTTYLTGAMDVHDVGVMDTGEIVFANTRFNCLAAVSETHSFRPFWKPEFISSYRAQDCCHLNGLAMAGGKPRFVTMVSRTDEPAAWRDHRTDGGVVMDVETGAVICEGLSMPHSPRVHQGKLWVLNSGTGELGWVGHTDGELGEFKPLCFCPGFVRGLAFRGDYAFVGLSKPRYERFEGLALDGRLKEAGEEAWCGVQVIDLKKGVCAEWFRIKEKVSELYDVEVLPGIVCARSYSPQDPGLPDLLTME